MALRAGRGGLCPGETTGGPPPCLLVSPGLLPLRSRCHELLRLRSTEFPRVPCAEGVARAAAGGVIRLFEDDRRRHEPRPAPAYPRRAAPRFRDDDAAPQHHHLPIRAARS